MVAVSAAVEEEEGVNGVEEDVEGAGAVDGWCTTVTHSSTQQFCSGTDFTNDIMMYV